MFRGARQPGADAAAVPADAADGGHDADAAGLWGRVAARAVRRPAAVLGIGVLVFAALAVAATGYKTAGINRSTTAPAGSDAAAGNALLASDFPQSSASPSDLILRYAEPIWQHPQSAATAAAVLDRSGLFTGIAWLLTRTGPR